MSRPSRNENLSNRMRGFEMFATGSSKAEVARELGVTRTTITNWSREDKWEERLADVVKSANAAAEHAVGDVVAAALARLKGQTAKRIAELESLCGPSSHPTTRLRAILAWLKLAGVDRAMPNPTDPGTPRSLQLIEDLVHEEAS